MRWLSLILLLSAALGVLAACDRADLFDPPIRFTPEGMLVGPVSSPAALGCRVVLIAPDGEPLYGDCPF